MDKKKLFTDGRMLVILSIMCSIVYLIVGSAFSELWGLTIGWWAITIIILIGGMSLLGCWGGEGDKKENNDRV